MKIINSNVTINVKDLDRSISFYQSLGMTLKNRWGDHYAQMTIPGLEIGLHPTQDINLKEGSGNISIGFTTDDFEEAKSLLHTLFILVTEKSEDGGQFLHFKDPDGTAIYFIKPKW